MNATPSYWWMVHGRYLFPKKHKHTNEFHWKVDDMDPVLNAGHFRHDAWAAAVDQTKDAPRWLREGARFMRAPNDQEWFGGQRATPRCLSTTMTEEQMHRVMSRRVDSSKLVFLEQLEKWGLVERCLQRSKVTSSLTSFFLVPKG